jgi:hypothetical protein
MLITGREMNTESKDSQSEISTSNVAFFLILNSFTQRIRNEFSDVEFIFHFNENSHFINILNKFWNEFTTIIQQLKVIIEKLFIFEVD